MTTKPAKDFMTKPDTTPAASASRHTPEPWEISDNGTSVFNREHDDTVCHCESGISANLDFDNAGRIVACVNALAGMNPEAVPLMIEALKAARTCLEIDCAITPTERGTIQGPSDALALVNSALKGAK